MKKMLPTIVVITALTIWLIAWWKWYEFKYLDICLDMW